MRLLKTILFQTALMLGIYAILEFFLYLRVGKFELSFSQTAPLWMPVIFINVASLIWDRPVVRSFGNTEENIQALEAWLAKMSAKKAPSDSGVLRYQVSYLKSFDRDLLITIEADKISVEGVLRLLKSFPALT